ncbi:hypothetical protein [Hydrogenophaga sp.]|uniref:hypothetical protein n=1 Tax=Hydrogenophaga sp. TaxID=1904254 RepID=UPI002732A4EB|nr:hypothetical protein [Hydrogenophaga sp.]MDP3884677.1 hypothetical protein [Hydrogenophaga sp.]
MSETTRPTAPGPGGFVPRFGMYAGPNYAGGRALRPGEVPSAGDWSVQPIGFLDDVTRNHDINYTYIEKVYGGNDPASRADRNRALWQADKEMLGNMLRHQPGNWLEAQYRDAAIKAFVAKADTSYRPHVDVVSEWNRDLAGIDAKFPALTASDAGRAQWSLPGLVHSGATYASTGMEALSTSGVNTQVALLFNAHIQPGHIDPLKPFSRNHTYPETDRDDSRRILVPKRDPSSPNVFTAEGHIDGKRVRIWYDQENKKLVRTVYSGDQIESETTYQGRPATDEYGKKYGYANYEVSRQDHANGEPKGDPVKLPSIKALETPPLQESEHTRAIKPNVEQGQDARYPNKSTAADRVWHSGERAAPTPAPPDSAQPPDTPTTVTPKPVAVAAASGDSPPADAAQPTPGQASQAQQFKDQLGPRLAQLGMSEQQINTLAAAAAKEQTRFAGQGEAQAFYLSKDGNTIALSQAWPPLREFDIAQALGQSERVHWQEAVALGERQMDTADHRVLASAAEPDRSARQAA